MGNLRVVSSGLYTTIQDRGRFGFSKYGVPKSGAMDQRSFLLANAVLGNDENCAVIEWTMIPPILEFDVPTLISITGAICIPFLNGKYQKMNTPVKVGKGDVLRFKNIKKGCFGFVGVKNGFQVKKVLKSRSFYKGITAAFFLVKNDQIPYQKYIDFKENFSTVSVSCFWENPDMIYCFEGPEFDQLSMQQKALIFADTFSVSNTRNRMAIQLFEQIPNDISPIISAPVLPGTVQLTPSGKLIVLMRDCQITGGYPRILQLSQESINCIAQKRVGEMIRFEKKFF